MITDEQIAAAKKRGTDVATAEIENGAVHRIAYPLSGEFADTTTPGLLFMAIAGRAAAIDGSDWDDEVDLANAYEDAYNIAWQAHDDATGAQFGEQ